jgi:hypothetical protein
MTQFDKCTTDLMTNHEVLDVNQDPLGGASPANRSARRCGYRS